jgi:hypothetical protein
MRRGYRRLAPADNSFSDADIQKHSQQAQQVMKGGADRLHAHAISGEGFGKLQSDVFKIAGIKTAANSNMGVRRTSLPPSQVLVMDLKPGEVLSVIEGPNEYLI